MSQTLELLNAARTWLAQGQVVYLFHVARTWGSSPRPVGSLMAINGEGQHRGSLSGGCIEADLLVRVVRGDFRQQRYQLIEYSNDNNGRIRLPCGGSMEVFLERLEDAAELQPLVDAITQRQGLARELSLHSSGVTLRPATAFLPRFDGHTLSEYYGPRWRVLLIGANDLSRQVYHQCLALDYEVIVCEPRSGYLDNWDGAEATLTTSLSDEAVEEYVQDGQTAVLALSHDPRLDDRGLVQALYSPAFYIGALGSQRSARRRREAMLRMNIPTHLIDRIDAPIGLDIGSHTPAEIAISIAARLIQVRNRAASGVLHSVRQA